MDVQVIARRDRAHPVEQTLKAAEPGACVHDHVSVRQHPTNAFGDLRSMPARTSGRSRAGHRDRTSTKYRLPPRRIRTRSTASTPSTRLISSMIRVRMPEGAASSSASTVWRANRELTYTTIQATIRAATGSAFASHGMRQRSPAMTNARPRITTRTRPYVGAEVQGVGH